MSLTCHNEENEVTKTDKSYFKTLFVLWHTDGFVFVSRMSIREKAHI